MSNTKLADVRNFEIGASRN